MTPTELRDWVKRRRLSHQEAADLLAMSREGLRKNLYGVTEIGPQTVRIIELHKRTEALEDEILDINSHAERLD